MADIQPNSTPRLIHVILSNLADLSEWQQTLQTSTHQRKKMKKRYVTGLRKNLLHYAPSYPHPSILSPLPSPSTS